MPKSLLLLPTPTPALLTSLVHPLPLTIMYPHRRPAPPRGSSWGQGGNVPLGHRIRGEASGGKRPFGPQIRGEISPLNPKFPP